MRGRLSKAWPAVLPAFAGSAAIAAAAPAWADDPPAPPAPLRLDLVYNGDTMDIVSGGAVRGVTYVDRLLISADADLDRGFGWKGAIVHVDLMSNRGDTPGENAGTLMGVSRTELDPRPIRIVQAYVQQTFAGGRAAVVAGFYDIGADFYATPAAEMFLGPAGGLAPELAATGPPDFPETALMLQLKVQTGHGTYAEAMAADARQGVIGDLGGADFSFRDGLIVTGEVGYSGPFKVGVGYWRYTDSKPDIRDLGAGGAPARRVAQGAYALVQVPLSSPADGVRKTTAFLKGGVSDGATTPFAGTWVAGMLVEHVLRGRPDSALAMAVIQGRFGQRFRANQADAGLPTGASETDFEITYSDKVAPHLELQPDLQWVHRPSGQAAIPDALVLSLRFTISAP